MPGAPMLVGPPISLGVLGGAVTTAGYLLATEAAEDTGITTSTGIALSVVVLSVAAVARIAYRMGISDRKIDQASRDVTSLSDRVLSLERRLPPSPPPQYNDSNRTP